MRLAALYDLHGNARAVAAVLEELASLRVERIVIGGDLIPGPFVREVLELLQRAPAPCFYLRGNGENDLLAARAGGELARVPATYRPDLLWNLAQLGAAELAFLESWPAAQRCALPLHGRTLFCHATPRTDDELFTERSPEPWMRAMLAGCDAELVVCGHTHLPFDRAVGRQRVVNAGSVGLPFGRRGADWLLLGERVELRHTDYDVEAAAREASSSGYPNAAWLARSLREPPAAEVMIEVFERARAAG